MKKFLFLKSIVLPILYLFLFIYCILFYSAFDGPIAFTGIGIYLNEIFERYLLIIFVIFLTPVIYGIVFFAKYRILKTLNMDDNEMVESKLLRITKLININIIISTIIIFFFLGLFFIINAHTISQHPYHYGALPSCVPGTQGY